MCLTIYLSQRAQLLAYEASETAANVRTFDVPPDLVGLFEAAGGTITPEGVAVLDARWVDHTGAHPEPVGQELWFAEPPANTAEALRVILGEVYDARKDLLGSHERLMYFDGSVDEQVPNDSYTFSDIHETPWAQVLHTLWGRWYRGWSVGRLVSILHQKLPMPEPFCWSEENIQKCLVWQPMVSEYGHETAPIQGIQDMFRESRQQFLAECKLPMDQIAQAMQQNSFKVGPNRFLLDELWAAQPGLQRQVDDWVANRRVEQQNALAAWLTEHAPDETAAARYRAGVLNKDKITKLIADVELAPLSGFGEFAPPKPQGVTHDPEVNCQTPSYERGHDPATNMSDHEWGVYQAIRKQAPREAKLELREHCVTCRICGAMVSVNACHVGLTRFGHKVERQYRLDSPVAGAGSE